MINGECNLYEIFWEPVKRPTFTVLWVLKEKYKPRNIIRKPMKRFFKAEAPALIEMKKIEARNIMQGFWFSKEKLELRSNDSFLLTKFRVLWTNQRTDLRNPLYLQISGLTEQKLEVNMVFFVIAKLFSLENFF